MRLCTNCISCTNCLPLHKRALFPAEPPPNRPQISDRNAALPRTICADSQEENKGKRRENILTASPSVRKVTPRLLAPGLLQNATDLFETPRFVLSCTRKAILEDRRKH